MERKDFIKLFSAAGLAIVALGAGSCDHRKRIYVVNTRKCTGCEKCLKICSHHAITTKNNKAFIEINRCRSCGNCEDYCRRHAVISFAS